MRVCEGGRTRQGVKLAPRANEVHHQLSNARDRHGSHRQRMRQRQRSIEAHRRDRLKRQTPACVNSRNGQCIDEQVLT